MHQIAGLEREMINAVWVMDQNADEAIIRPVFYIVRRLFDEITVGQT
jgi:hypothetical protein